MRQVISDICWNATWNLAAASVNAALNALEIHSLQYELGGFRKWAAVGKIGLDDIAGKHVTKKGVAHQAIFVVQMVIEPKKRNLNYFVKLQSCFTHMNYFCECAKIKLSDILIKWQKYKFWFISSTFIQHRLFIHGHIRSTHVQNKYNMRTLWNAPRKSFMFDDENK